MSNAQQGPPGLRLVPGRARRGGGDKTGTARAFSCKQHWLPERLLKILVFAMPPKDRALGKARHGTPRKVRKHGDHDIIVKRLEKYIEAYRTAKSEAVMEFYDTEDFEYSDFGGAREGMGLKEVKAAYDHTFNNFTDLVIETFSIHGHKDFTAWEWQIICRPIKDFTTGAPLEKEAPKQKMIGCTLMWWSPEGKIVKNHDYVQVRSVD